MSKKHRHKRTTEDHTADNPDGKLHHVVRSRQVIDDLGVVVGSIEVTIWRTPDEQ
jgi:hypothetical protein